MTAETILQFIGAMEAVGVRPVESIVTQLSVGGIVRFRAEGDKPGRNNAWAVLHLDGVPAGAFGHYRLGISETWNGGTVSNVGSLAERKRRASEWRALRDKRNIEQAEAWKLAASEANRLWACGARADRQHAYLARKRLAGEGLRQLGNRLLVPMFDSAGRLWNVQRIGPDGSKRFLKGARTTGLWWMQGQPEAVICIGEGYATMAVVRHATGHAVATAFSARNLEAVASSVRAAWPDMTLILCADDDAHLPNNIGLQCATAAANAVGGHVALPPRKSR